MKKLLAGESHMIVFLFIKYIRSLEVYKPYLRMCVRLRGMVHREMGFCMLLYEYGYHFFHF